MPVPPLATPLPGDGPAPNPQVASRLEEAAALLDEQEADPFRVRAYRNAALSVRTHPVSVAELFREGGLAALEEIPGVGVTIARAIRELVMTGRLPMLERLRGEADPVVLFATIAGIGPRLAERLHHDLGIGTLEELELAAHDGRLRAFPGFGPKRVAAVLDALNRRLGRVRRDRAAGEPPTVAELLSVDQEYRDSFAGGRLPLIAPRRFNPEHRAWLPVLHTRRGDRHYTALFSNTAQAHRLDRTRDWVVIYGDGDREEHQATVVTARSGVLAGRRVVRGRERECAALGDAPPAPALAGAVGVP
ncbi:MAG TPA: helix-hairpin-helix domain-containing protein [Gemmatimonadales bacterium]|nr:helix-hairpin-helix domain-containing protein [Gemmatimonadales bacterium]